MSSQVLVAAGPAFREAPLEPHLREAGPSQLAPRGGAREQPDLRAGPPTPRHAQDRLGDRRRELVNQWQARERIDRGAKGGIAQVVLGREASAQTLEVLEKDLQGKETTPRALLGLVLSSPDFQRR